MSHEPRQYYAHSHPDFPNDPGKWQKLEDHLRATAELAREFAEPFGSGDWGHLAGLLHDLGKVALSVKLPNPRFESQTKVKW